jgi:tetratricopeptide (TPR) repeat protein
MCFSQIDKFFYIYPDSNIPLYMRYLFVTVIGLMLTGSLSAQTPASGDPFEVQARFYRMALKNYDLQAATIALYNMMALKPERADMKDSLALLYFAGERYAQASLVGEEIVKTDPKRKDMLELVAVSKQNLGMIKESLANYETLYAGEKSIYYLYQIATLQYQLKRYGECVASLDQIISNPESDKQKVTIRVQSGGQEVPMKAAALNVKGICAMELNQEESARENFNKALQIAPDFALAKGNLDSLDKKKEQPKQTNTTTSKTTSTTKAPVAKPK